MSIGSKVVKKTVESICISYKEQIKNNIKINIKDNSHTANYITSQINQMEPLLKWTMIGLIIIYASQAMICEQKNVDKMSIENQLKQFKKWKTSRIKVFREFINFHESLMILYWV